MYIYNIYIYIYIYHAKIIKILPFKKRHLLILPFIFTEFRISD